MKEKLMYLVFFAASLVFLAWVFAGMLNLMAIPLWVQGLWSIGSLITAILTGFWLSGVRDRREEKRWQKEWEDEAALNGWNDREAGDLDYEANSL